MMDDPQLILRLISRGIRVTATAAEQQMPDDGN